MRSASQGPISGLSPHFWRLLATATLNGLDPPAWLRDTLEKLPTSRYSNIDSLLPNAHLS